MGTYRSRVAAARARGAPGHGEDVRFRQTVANRSGSASLPKLSNQWDWYLCRRVTLPRAARRSQSPRKRPFFRISSEVRAPRRGSLFLWDCGRAKTAMNHPGINRTNWMPKSISAINNSDGPTEELWFNTSFLGIIFSLHAIFYVPSPRIVNIWVMIMGGTRRGPSAARKCVDSTVRATEALHYEQFPRRKRPST